MTVILWSIGKIFLRSQRSIHTKTTLPMPVNGLLAESKTIGVTVLYMLENYPYVYLPEL